ncbi:MAG: G1 family endopeptidase [Candidatus Berkelbacteria bacterium]|nr:G1 family endopeptidase [Candidatus Berkelbacteria bacterium]
MYTRKIVRLRLSVILRRRIDLTKKTRAIRIWFLWFFIRRAEFDALNSNRYNSIMEAVLIIVAIVSVICFVIGLIKPTFFSFLFRSHTCRLIIGPTFFLIAVVSLILVGVFYGNNSNKNSNNNSNTKSAEKPTVKEMKNWSGYVKYGLENSMTSVSGDWTVPSVQPSSKIQTASNWIGIGGYATTGLIQIATQSIAGPSGGTPGTLYDAVWECLPNPSVLITDFKINAGDKISASIKKTDALWTMSLKNNNTGQTFEKTTACATDGSTAEWVLEKPPIGVQTSFKLDIMPSFSPTTFSSLLVNGSVPGWSNMIEVRLEDDNNQIIASPNETLSQNGQEFTIQDVRK